jgi:hypothetical protein
MHLSISVNVIYNFHLAKTGFQKFQDQQQFLSSNKYELLIFLSLSRFTIINKSMVKFYNKSINN